MNNVTDLEIIDTTVVTQHGLPGAVFSSRDIFELECDSVFRDGWVSIATAQQLREPGDVLPVSVAGHALLITRDRDMKIHVFRNVCRHKAAMLIDGPCSGRSTIVCPYHRWTYRLDGQILAAPYYHGTKNVPLDDGLRKKLGLIPVRFEVWWDIIFVNLSGTGQAFSDYVKPLSELLSDHNGEDISLVSASDYETRANWKLVVENFLDGYHVGFVHSQASSVDATLGQENLILSENIVGLRLEKGAAEKPQKTERQLPHFPALPTEKQAAQQWFLLFPNTLFFVDPRWVQTIVVKPHGAEHCSETLSIYVTHRDATGDEFAEERAVLHQVLNKVNSQDIGILRYIQKTRSSEVGDSGNWVEGWDDVPAEFHNMWLKKMKISIDMAEQCSG